MISTIAISLLAMAPMAGPPVPTPVASTDTGGETPGLIGTRLTAAEIERRPSTTNASGVRTTILAGDPAKPGLYTIMLTLPAHIRLAPHRHRDTRTTTVLAGTWHVGYGDTARNEDAKTLGPGGFYTEPAGQSHFGHAGSDPVTLSVSGFGPTDTVAVASAPAPDANRP